VTLFSQIRKTYNEVRSLERKSSPDTHTNQETGSGGTRNRAGAEEVLCVYIKNSLCFGEACLCVC